MHVDARQPLRRPPSITQDYLNYNKGSTFLATVATLVSIALLIFLLRVYIRIRLLRFFGVDDWLGVIAALCALGVLIAMSSLTQLGLGKHYYAVPMENILEMGPWILSIKLLSIIGIGCVKLSVAFFLLPKVHQPGYRRFLYCMIVFIIPWTLIWFSMLHFECVPIAATWDLSLQSRARCMSHLTAKNMGLVSNVINILTDLAFVALPLLFVWGLRLRLEIRISLIAALCFGFVACAAAIIRTPLIYNFNKEDEPYAHGAWVLIWSVIELTTSMTAANLPSLKPILSYLAALIKRLKRLRSPSISHKSISSPRPVSQHTFHSLPPLSFSRPRSAYFPTRFHDHTSDLDFDIETPPSRTRAHSRNPSGVTTFSTFTNLTYFITPEDCDEGATTTVNGRSRAMSKALDEHDEDTAGLRAFSGISARAGYAVSVTSGDTSCDVAPCMEDGKSIKRAASEESGLRLGTRSEEGGIIRTTEVKVT